MTKATIIDDAITYPKKLQDEVYGLTLGLQEMEEKVNFQLSSCRIVCYSFSFSFTFLVFFYYLCFCLGFYVFLCS